MTTRTLAISTFILAVGVGLGYWLAPSMSMHHDMSGDGMSDGGMAMTTAGGDGPCAGGAAADYWVAPMDANFRRDAPGKSPMGMDLVPFCGNDTGGADVAISPQIAQNLGVRTAAVERRSLTTPVRAVGTVGWNENSFQMIHTRAEGWLEQFAIAAEGDDVEAGQTLYALFAPKLAAAEAEYIAARSNPRLRTAAAARLQALGYTQAQVRAVARRGSAAERQMREAPGDLTVAELGARQGQFVMPGTHVMTLADLSKVWLTVQVPESQADAIRTGLLAVATVAAYPEHVWEGTVDHVYPTLDAATRSLRVRLVFDNADRRLRPGMFAAAVIQTPAINNALLVPTQAVIRTGDGARVVKAIGDGGFDVVAVKTGHTASNQMQILDGLQDGDRVVTSGQFLLDSEANVDAEALRLAAASVPVGEADATIQSVDAQRRNIMLQHGAFEPVGSNGMSMPGMTMGFGLAEDLDLSNLSAGDRVRVTVENPSPGTYTVTRIDPISGTSMNHGGMDHEVMGHDSMDHSGMDHGSMDHGTMEHSGMDHGEMSHGDMTDATVQAIDPAARRITLKHARIESLNMPAMTMGFDVADSVDLGAVSPGDAIQFDADSPAAGDFRVTKIAPK
nr:efflux RND transporter periplasmic adaptor subunit [Oceanococcus sp. HetDA_MAG_MS8]